MPPARAPYELGQAGEKAAQAALTAAGYTLLESNFRVTGAEIDLVCRGPDGLVFVEVRARAEGAVEPSATLTRAKLRALMRGARAWLVRHRMQGSDWRFCVVSVKLDANGRPLATSLLDDPFVHLPEYHRGDP